MEEAQREKEELVKNMALLQQEKEQLEAEKESLQKECEQEKEACAQLRRENQVSWEWTEPIFEVQIGVPALREGRKMFAFVIKNILSVKQNALFLFCCIV